MTERELFAAYGMSHVPSDWPSDALGRARATDPSPPEHAAASEPVGLLRAALAAQRVVGPEAADWRYVGGVRAAVRRAA